MPTGLCCCGHYGSPGWCRRPPCRDPPQAHTDWTVIANQWGRDWQTGAVEIASDGSGDRPTQALSATAREQHKEALAAYTLEAKIAELRMDAAEKAARKQLVENPPR